MFNKINFHAIILNQYMQSWYIWAGLFVVGIIMIKYSHIIGTTYRDRKKIESSGSGLVALSVVLHLGVLWALIYKP